MKLSRHTSVVFEAQRCGTARSLGNSGLARPVVLNRWPASPGGTSIDFKEGASPHELCLERFINT